MLTVEDIKNNLRIDYDEDDQYIGMLLEGAKMFVLGTLDLDTLPVDPRVDTVVFMLVALWYENRVVSAAQGTTQVPFTITAMIHQLRGLA
ncbi:MAG: phage gp6-like head-tail connector protein [Escherichia coli]|nr:phage gp6-like head-tail connector protein [Escherichia coli]DAF84358.1 MAG TPA: head tail connector [Caudoviricetes sp.]